MNTNAKILKNNGKLNPTTHQKDHSPQPSHFTPGMQG
jgi:hypothetical protein